MPYIPKPPRAWSRVQGLCTYTVPDLPDQYDVYVPLTGKTVSQGQADYETKMFYKGNILQYKGNSARLTKSQKYSQLARCGGPNRTKVFATQSETYTNPNTTGLLRVGYTTYSYPNEIVGAPNNISGPFAYNISNPNDCSNNSVQDGGILVCGTLANPCTGEIYKKAPNNSFICAPSSASNVPGRDALCWNNKIQTYFPRQNLTNNNSGNKWPVNYKGFVSALQPNSPYLTVDVSCNDAILNWSINNQCIPVNQFNIYNNSSLIESVPSNIKTTTIQNLDYNKLYSFNVASLINMNGEEQLIYSNVVNTYVSNNTYSITLSGIPVLTDNTQVTLNWSALSYDCTCSWQLYQNNILIGNYPIGTTSVTLSGLIPGNNYTYYIKSLNCYNSVITQSNNVYVTPTNIQVQQSTPGTYSLPILTNYLYYNNVTVIGGGGGGGGGGVMGTEDDSGCIGGSGGGAGGISIKNSTVYITTQTSLSYTIGSGGLGGNLTSGQNGNSSTFGDGLSISITANGGSGGLYNGTIFPQGNLTINNGGLGGSSSGGDTNGTGGNGGNSGSVGSPTGENIGFVNYATSGSISTIVNGSGGGGGGGCIYRTSGSGGVYFDSIGASGGNGGNGAIGGSTGQYGNGGSGTGTVGYGGSGGGGVGGNRFSSSSPTTPTGTGGNGIYGSGGGGGGASHTISNTGIGGNGGNGFVGFTVYTINIS